MNSAAYTDLKGKTALLTGASQGIGKATAQVLAQNGANLILVARSRERLESLKSELSQFKIKIETHGVDLSDFKATETFFKTVKDYDFAINNAGTEGKIAPIEQLSLEDFDQVFDLNVKSLFYSVSQQFSYFKSASKKGVIINVSSTAGLKGFEGSSLYCASKHAVLGLTKAAALEGAHHNIRVNAICPGATDTPMMRRILKVISKDTTEDSFSALMKPEQIANAIAWLCSEQSSAVVAHSLIVDQGSIAR